MNNRDTGTIKCIARGKLMGHYGLLICALIMANLITSILSSICTSVMSTATVGGTAAYYLAEFIITILAALLSVGISYMILGIVRGESIGSRDLFFAISNHPDRYILANILQTIIFIIPFLPGATVLYQTLMPDAAALLYGDSTESVSASALMVLLGIILLIAGFIVFIWLYLRYALLTQVMLDNRDYGVIESFRASADLMKGNKGRLFYLGISFVGWIILGALSFGIGYLWISPYINASVTVFYLDVIGDNLGHVAGEDDIADADVHFDEVG